MNRLLNAALASVLVLSVAPLALATQSKTHKTTHSISGSIESYDAAAHTLTVKTTTSSVVFHVAQAKVYLDSKSVTLDDLTAQAGAHATVSYTVKGSDKTATTVRVAAAKASK